MVMCMKKLLKITIILIIILITFGNSVCLARPRYIGADGQEHEVTPEEMNERLEEMRRIQQENAPEINLNDFEPEVEKSDAFAEKMSGISKIQKVVGLIVLFLAIVLFAIHGMKESAISSKFEFITRLPGVLTGALLVTSSTLIISLLYSFAISIF